MIINVGQLVNPFLEFTSARTGATVLTSDRLEVLNNCIEYEIPFVTYSTLDTLKMKIIADNYESDYIEFKTIDLDSKDNVVVKIENDIYIVKTMTPYKYYDLPIASKTSLGGIIVGDNLSISSNGVLSATGGGTSDYNGLTNKPVINIFNEDSSNPTCLFDLDEGIYNIYGYIKFYPTYSGISAITSPSLMTIVKSSTTTYVQLFEPYGNKVTGYEITSTSYEEVSDKNIITAVLSADKSLTSTSTTNDISLNQYSIVGNKLSMSSGKIVVGSGVSNVLVSGSVRIKNDATSGTTAYNCYVYKNDEVVASGRMYGIGNGETGACSTPVALISVSQGDIIKLSIWKASSNKCTIGSTGNATMLTVQTI